MIHIRLMYLQLRAWFGVRMNSSRVHKYTKAIPKIGTHNFGFYPFFLLIVFLHYFIGEFYELLFDSSIWLENISRLCYISNILEYIHTHSFRILLLILAILVSIVASELPFIKYLINFIAHSLIHLWKVLICAEDLLQLSLNPITVEQYMEYAKKYQQGKLFFLKSAKVEELYLSTPFISF